MIFRKTEKNDIDKIIIVINLKLLDLKQQSCIKMQIKTLLTADFRSHLQTLNH